EQDRVGLDRQVRRQNREKGGEPILVIDQCVGEGALRRATPRPNDQIDVRDFIAIASQRLANQKLVNLRHANSSLRSSQTTFVRSRLRSRGLAILVISIPPRRDRLA